MCTLIVWFLSTEGLRGQKRKANQEFLQLGTNTKAKKGGYASVL